MKSFREIVVLTFHNLSSCIALPVLIFVLCIGCSVRKEPTPIPVTITEKPTWQIVETKYGKVKAEDGELETWLWKAIPYAKPPVGPLRWKAPRNPNPWEGIREAKEFCEICPQYNFSKKIVGNEDCLYLNIWRPKSSERDLPVYFWIHGGGNSIQSPYLKDFSCGSVAKKSNVIVVTMNYRLGPMGWFTHPALRSGKQGGEYDDSGNHGTLDLIKALEWVKDNIKAFGGNPENILIGGESAGARNVLTLIISPAAKGLFHKAMSQSGGQRTYSLTLTLTKVRKPVL